MITLKTLSKATPREVFEQVKNHLLTQNEKSMEYIREDDGPGCAYKGEDSLQCAAGCLIADDEYSPEMECKTWDELAGNRMVPSAHRNLIRALQRVHDENVPQMWPEELAKVQKRFPSTRK